MVQCVTVEEYPVQLIYGLDGRSRKIVKMGGLRKNVHHLLAAQDVLPYNMQAHILKYPPMRDLLPI